ncbi:MAG: hypothetical protein VKN33_03225 [Candidatus Sericytochromatia bacterium]|nr:hypothetical protein [Candidatus Sericytochromatia bacterium]
MSDAHLPLSVLLAPLLLAAMAIALMHLLSPASSQAGDLRRSFGSKRSPETPKMSLTPARYLGGHPAWTSPVDSPWVGLYEDRCEIFDTTGKSSLMNILWKDVEEVKVLTPEQMKLAASSVRGLEPDAFSENSAIEQYVRIRHTDERGWWQHTVLGLDPSHGAEQAKAIKSAYEQGRAST